MNKIEAKPEVKVTLTITPGPVSPAARASWKKFWSKLISETKGIKEGKSLIKEKAHRANGGRGVGK